jgi:hypothetical protein
MVRGPITTLPNITVAVQEGEGAGEEEEEEDDDVGVVIRASKL